MVKYKIKGIKNHFRWYDSILGGFILTLFILLIILYLDSLYIINKEKNNNSIVKQELMLKIDSLSTMKYERFRCTYYTLTKSQTDSKPLETADGTNHDAKIIGNYRHCAISPDRLASYPLGTIIIVSGLQKELNGVWMIRDVTNKKIKNTIDFMLPNGKNKPITNSCFVCKIY